MQDDLPTRGFLPQEDPVYAFPAESELSMLDTLGRDLPSLLIDPGLRDGIAKIKIPLWPKHWDTNTHEPYLRLYYVRLGFLASAYINQIGMQHASLLPKNISRPLVKVCTLLQRPPILSYDGYALYNWKRFDSNGPIALGNIDTIQNFVHMYDEHWFILIHVEIEAIAANILSAIAEVEQVLKNQRFDQINACLKRIAKALWQQVATLKRIPENMNPNFYYKTFRPYIRFFENVVYEGCDIGPMSSRGETGAQSSIIPTLVAFMKIVHQQSMLTEHLLDMRRYMPYEHREYIARIETMPAFRDEADKDCFNEVLEAMACFREIHYGWAQEYINRWTQDPRGTGGTLYMKWLKQLIDETRAFQIP